MKFNLVSVLLFLISHIVYSTSNISSLLYNRNGKLVADTSYHISKMQLSKFSLIEERFVKQILDSLKISKLLLENGIPYESIISFTVDDKSCFNHIKVETVHTSDSLVKRAVMIGSEEMIIHPLLKFSCKINLKAKEKTIEKYYLPIKFNNDKKFREIKNGWLYYHIPSEPIEKREYDIMIKQ